MNGVAGMFKLWEMHDAGLHDADAEQRYYGAREMFGALTGQSLEIVDELLDQREREKIERAARIAEYEA